MEPLKSYFTKQGWKNDYQKTKQHFKKFIGQSDDITDIINQYNSKSGKITVNNVMTVASMPIFAVMGTIFGGLLGYGAGIIADLLPFINQIAPYVADKCDIAEGLSKSQMNTQLYQFTGALFGFWGGLLFPISIIKEDAEKAKKQTIEEKVEE